MAQVKLRPGVYTVLFCVAVFVLTSVGLAVIHYEMLPFPFWFMFVYIVAWILLFAFAADFFGGRGKLSGKKALVLAFGVMLISTLFTHLVWTVVTPRWVFSVSTDKSTYQIGEDVRITVSLTNKGLISHSFRSASDNPVVVSVGYQEAWRWVWCSSISRSITDFSVEPEEVLEREFSWNQTNTVHPGSWNQTYMPGTYWISAFIPKDTSDIFGFDNLFSAWTNIIITST